MTEEKIGGDWFNEWFDGLGTDDLVCVRDKFDPAKVNSYCREVRCPNLVPRAAFDSKLGTLFGNNHPLVPGLNIKFGPGEVIGRGGTRRR